MILKNKKPNNDPTNVNIKSDISIYPSNHPVLIVIIPKVVKAIIDKPVASPSSPSVKLTALELAIKTNNIL